VFGRIRISRARLSPLLGRSRWILAAIAGGSLAAGLAEAGVLALIAHIAAKMSVGTGQETVELGPITLGAPTPVLLIAAGVLATARLLLQVVVARLPVRLSGAVQTRLRTELLHTYLAASWSEKEREKDGHFQELMGHQASAAGTTVLQLANAVSALLMFLTLAVSAFVLGAGVAAAVIATSLVLFGGLRPMSRRVRSRSKATSAASVAQSGAVAESVRMAEEVHVFGAMDAERSRIGALIKALETRFVSTRALSVMVPVLYQGGVVFLLIGGLALLYALGTGRLATLGAIVILLLRASAYGQKTQTAYQHLGESLPYLDRVTRSIEHYRGHEREPGDRPISSIEVVELEDVSFNYRPDVPALHSVSFAIRAGEAIGMVGPTGAGKSTILQILLRLREPNSGSYRINGVPAAEIDDHVWARKVAFLPQEPHLLHASVADNIRFFREWVDEAAIRRAARLAHIDEDVMSWRDGYGTIIGQRRDAVSGGQRQRLCLARALAGVPKLLILDEPTSSLDPQSERLIQESLEELRGDLTLVVVAHRLSTLQLCDRVMVIRDGRLEAFEPARRLYDSNDFYRRATDLAAAGKLDAME
jgi:ATP-binding cassette subfamily B protein